MQKVQARQHIECIDIYLSCLMQLSSSGPGQVQLKTSRSGPGLAENNFKPIFEEQKYYWHNWGKVTQEQLKQQRP